MEKPFPGRNDLYAGIKLCRVGSGDIFDLVQSTAEGHEHEVLEKPSPFSVVLHAHRTKERYPVVAFTDGGEEDPCRSITASSTNDTW